MYVHVNIDGCIYVLIRRTNSRPRYMFSRTILINVIFEHGYKGHNRKTIMEKQRIPLYLDDSNHKICYNRT